MTSNLLCKSSFCLPPSCCLNETFCSQNSTHCSFIQCGVHFCHNQCCKKDICLSEFQCYFEKNRQLLYYVLAFLICLFIYAAYYLYKKQLFFKSSLLKKKKILITKEIPQKTMNEKNQENPLDVAKDLSLNHVVNHPLQKENNLTDREDLLIKLTEREDLLKNSNLDDSDNKELEFASHDKKDLTKYIIKNRNGSKIHVNLRNLSLSQTAEKIRKFVSRNWENRKKNEGIKRFKSINLELPLTGVLEAENIHKKYSSLINGNLNISGSKTP